MPAPRLDTSVPGWQRQAEFQRACRRCGAQLYFVRSRQTDRLIPYTDSGISHFEDCPFADEFSKKTSNQPANASTTPPPPPQPKPAPQQAGLFGDKATTHYGVD